MNTTTMLAIERGLDYAVVVTITAVVLFVGYQLVLYMRSAR